MLYPVRGGKKDERTGCKAEEKVKIVSNKEKVNIKAMGKNKDTRRELERREREVAVVEKK